MRAVVTGVAGFIGSTLANYLLRRPDVEQVIGVDSFTDYYSADLKRANLSSIADSRFRMIEGDLMQVDLEPLTDATVVFHQAGQPGVRKSWGADFEHYTQANIGVTQRLLEFSRQMPNLRRFVYASSSSVYGDAERYPTLETDRPMPHSPYGVTKLAAEHLCSLYASNFGTPTVSLRYFTVYGPRQRPDMAFRKFISAIQGGEPIQVYGDGEQIREFTFVEDIVRANVLASEAELTPGTVMNLSGGSSVSVNEVIETLREIHGNPIRVDHVGTVAGDVRRTGGDSSLASGLLGWKPVISLRDGLAAEYEWLDGLRADGPAGA